MLDPYRMVIVNLVASAVLLVGLIAYRYVYPRKKFNLFAVLLLISLLPIISLLRKGAYESGDFNFNIYKSMSLLTALKDGQLLPGWAGELNSGYGYPLFIFTYPLPYYTILLFKSLGLSFIASEKLALASAFIASGTAMFLFIRSILNKTAAFVASVFYLFSPYHLVDTHFRVAIGEVFSFVFLPLVFFGVTKLIQTNKFRWFALVAVSQSLLILSHQAISLISFPMITSYTLLMLITNKKTQLRNIVYYCLAIAFGYLLSAFYFLPVLFELKYTLQAIGSEISFSHISDFLFSPWRWGFLFQGPKGELSFVVGYTQLVIVTLAVILAFKKTFKKQNKTVIYFFLAWFFMLFFLMQSFSKPVWNFLPIFKNFQFSYRLLVAVSFTTSILSAFAVLKMKNKYLVFMLVFVTILYTILNWGQRRVIPEINDSALRKNLPLSTVNGEGLSPAAPKWVDKDKIWMDKIPEFHLETINGQAKIADTFRNSYKHEYAVQAKTDIYLKENTLYFPGWIVTANGKEIPIEFQNNKYSGVITFRLKKGEYYLSVVFGNTTIRTASQYLSLFTMLVLICSFFILYLRSKKIVRFSKKYLPPL